MVLEPLPVPSFCPFLGYNPREPPSDWTKKRCSPTPVSWEGCDPN